jgi:serine/threonine-protein kinase
MAESGIPAQLGRFQVVRKLGEGGMGAVYEGVDPQLGRHVALKLLSKSLSAQAEFRERFRREAVAMAAITHPHVLQVYELGEQDGLPFFAMEQVEGGDCLVELQKKGSLPVGKVCRWVYQAAQGLAAAADKGLVHRDVKPANLMLHNGQVKVSDFGIAREVAASSKLTRMGLVMGTPDYMAPEQAMGQPVDPRADQYALGGTLFHLLAGRPLYVGTPGEVMQQHVDATPPELLSFRVDAPGGLGEVLRQMLARTPDGRFASYEALCTALEPFLDSSETAAPGALEFVEGPLQGKRFELPEGEFVVGRQPDCNLVLDTAQASRRHALFLREGEKLTVRDLESRNGILVNGVRALESKLRVGDRVRVGGETLVVVPPKKAAVAPPPELAPRWAAMRTVCQAAGSEKPELVMQALGVLLRLPGGPTRLAVLRFDEGNKVKPLAHEARSNEDKSLPPLTAAITHVQSRGESLVIKDVKTDSRFASVKTGVCAVVCVPVRANGKVWGALYVDAREPRPFLPEDVALFESVAQMVGLVLTRK